MERIKLPHLRGGATIGAILVHPSFRPFAGLMLPHPADVRYSDIPLSEAGLLLPGRCGVSEWAIESSLNILLDEAEDGQMIFLPLRDDVHSGSYSYDTSGIFVYRGRPGAPFALVCPGGGFAWWGGLHEGFPVAMQICKKGYTACVVRYRTGLGPVAAAQDLAGALTYVLDNADALGVCPKNYSLWGLGAGGRLAATVGDWGAQSFGGSAGMPPSAVVTAYSAFGDMPQQGGVAWFGVVGALDRKTTPQTHHARAAELASRFIAAQVEVYKATDHGFGIGFNTPADGWVAKGVAFWERFISRDPLPRPVSPELTPNMPTPADL